MMESMNHLSVRADSERPDASASSPPGPADEPRCSSSCRSPLKKYMPFMPETHMCPHCSRRHQPRRWYDSLLIGSFVSACVASGATTTKKGATEEKTPSVLMAARRMARFCCGMDR